jgi:hypothetical protein
MLFENWDAVETAVGQVADAVPGSFAVNTIANARDLLNLCRASCPLPVEVQKGYWNTISISWPQFEIEVFESRLEIYDFKADGGTDIWYEEHTPRAMFSARFLDELPRLTRKPLHASH